MKQDPQQRRQNIIDAATDLLTEHHPDALTHRAVAKKADIPLGTLTRHFPLIAQLRAATLEQFSRESDDELQKLENRLSHSQNPLEDTTALMLEFLNDQRHLNGTLALITAAHSDAQYREVAFRWTKHIRRILSQYFGEDAAIALQIFVDGVAVQVALSEEPIDADFFATTVRTLLNTTNTQEN